MEIMSISKKYVKCFIAFCWLCLIFALSSCNSSKELDNNHIEQQKTIKQASVKLDSDSIIEIKQQFIEKNSSGAYLSESHELNIENNGFILISAYTLDNATESNFYYGIKSDTDWQDWVKVAPDHTLNKNRTVYSGTNVFTNISEIRFKSDQPIKQPLIIRIYIAN